MCQANAEAKTYSRLNETTALCHEFERGFSLFGVQTKSLECLLERFVFLVHNIYQVKAVPDGQLIPS